MWCLGQEELGVITRAQSTDKEQFLAKDLTDGHKDELTPHQKERDSEIVQVWDCIANDNLKDLIGTTYTNKMHLLFSSSILGTPKLRVLDLEQHWMGDPLGSFLRKRVSEDKASWKDSC